MNRHASAPIRGGGDRGVAAGAVTLRGAHHAVHDPILTYRSYVGGKDIDSDKHVYTVTTRSILDDVFESLTLKRRLEQRRTEPQEAGHRVVGRVALADDDTVAAASAAAAQAAVEWARVPHARRMALGAAVRRRIVEGCDAMVDVLIAEGTPRALAEWQVAGLLETFSEETLGWLDELMHREFTHGSRRLVVRRQPDGVVCVNPPQNAPAASALFGITALMAGNAVVVRAPRSAPLGVMYALREFVVPALEEIGAPAGVLNVVCGRPGPMMRHWLETPHTDDILYIGSTENGLAFQEECVRRGKKPILELAGNDCVVIWRDADLDTAAEALTECFYGSGQICMVPNQVLVHPAVADELLDRLRTAVSRLRPGYPDEDGVLLSPVLRSERFFEFVKDALDHGARVVHGARRLEVDGSPSDTGLFLEPTVLRIDGLTRARDVEAVRCETFFPLLPVVVPEAADDDELLGLFLEYVNSNPYGLRNSVWADDERILARFEQEIVNGGLLKINDSHIGFLPYLPTHGGTGLTGGVFGEANYPMLRTSHLQGVSVARGIRPHDAVFGSYAALRQAREEARRSL
ncbi:aldehyde dehydrogenase [Streptomyces ficellus]|uniref:Aldehyde dehydrogenase n=1 Tax=Streptomyces ficellus TaxID=1977088 RepID=A0ABT7ZCA6_9ACTN|nr:aldehyde dehydrogenase [Streptomyces ficellus]MDN3297070.1 aldehyde dehydrogenase [Streptomyces ficellus]